MSKVSTTISLCLIGVLFSTFSASSSKIEFISVVFRHGDRTPTSIYPEFQNINETFYPYGLGGLTNDGKQREYNIGKTLRSRYSSVLGKIALENTIKAISSDFVRTKQSLLLVLAGLYPPSGVQRWDRLLNWQPIPTSYNKLKDDKLFFGLSCQRMKDLLNQYHETDEYKTTRNKYEDLLKSLEAKTGVPNFGITSGLEMYYNIVALKNMFKPLPPWISEVYPFPLIELASVFYNSYTFNDEAIKYAGGFLMKEIIGDIRTHILGREPRERKISLYSGHELNVVFILNVLGVYEGEVPDFGSYVTFELHNMGNRDYGIKVLFENYAENRPIIKVLPGCAEICPINIFISLINNRLPTEKEDEECIINLDTSL